MCVLARQDILTKGAGELNIAQQIKRNKQTANEIFQQCDISVYS